jgi:aspartate 1-decarboxylase
MLKSKIHRATITNKQIKYEGSIAVDTDLLDASDILSGEQVHVLNLNNGNRFVTYAIPAPRGSGAVMLNGPAARLGEIGDQVIILSYSPCDEAQAKELKARVVTVDEHNQAHKIAEGDQ